MDYLQPEGWNRPAGYSNGIKVSGEMIFVAGQVGWDENEEIVGNSMSDQVEQALKNIVAILNVGGASPKHIVRMTWYVSDIDTYVEQRAQIGDVYRRVMGKHFPVMSLFEVSRLLETGAMVEIEATAVVPSNDGTFR